MTIYSINVEASTENPIRHRIEYRLEGDYIFKYECYRYKYFNGRKSCWKELNLKVESWALDDPNMPELLKQYI